MTTTTSEATIPPPAQWPRSPEPPTQLLERTGRHVVDYDALRSFDAVAEWDATAAEIALALQACADELLRYRAWLLAQLAIEEQVWRARSFFYRLFAGRAYRNHVTAVIGTVDAHGRRLLEIRDELEDRVASTPDDADQLDEMLDALVELKRDLQLDLKEVKAAMRQARSSARSQGTHIGPAFSKFQRAANRHQRLVIRMQLEAKLRDGESEADAIERQILAIERRAAWLQRFQRAKKASRKARDVRSS